MRRRDVLGTLAGSAVVGPLAGGHVAGSQPRPGTAAEARPAFAPLGSLAIAGAREAVVGPDGTTVYVAALDGFAVVDAGDPTSLRLLAERREILPAADGGPLAGIQDVAVDGDRLLVVGPAHPRSDALAAAVCFDVSEPAAPRLEAVHRTDHPIHNADLVDGIAYLTANDGERNPLATVDLLGPEPAVVGRWSLADEDAAWGRVPARLRPLHDVTVRGGVAHCSCWDAGTWLVDVADPGRPYALGRVGGSTPAELEAVEDVGLADSELPGNHHSTAVGERGGLVAVGHEAWDADGDGRGGPGGVTLVDATDPAAPEPLGTIPPPPTADASRRGVWTTAHNATLGEGRLYSAWYQGGVRVHDVSAPRAPREVAGWSDPATTRFWTAVRTPGAVVAASMGTETGEPGLYAFPVPDGDYPATGEETPRRDGSVVATPGMADVVAAGALLGGAAAWGLARRRGG